MQKEKQLYDDRCGATTRAGTPCQQKAGWGTDHVGEGKCKLHGGASTGPPKKNKNAVSTGEFETIWFDTLDEKEQQLYGKVKENVLDLIEDDIKLIEIRIRRMMQRVKNSDDPQNIEEALTRVQGKKTKLLKLKYQVENNSGPIDVDISNYINAIKSEAKEVWQDEE